MLPFPNTPSDLTKRRKVTPCLLQTRAPHCHHSRPTGLPPAPTADIVLHDETKRGHQLRSAQKEQLARLIASK